MSLECDFTYNNGRAQCRVCGKECAAPRGPVRAKCGIRPRECSGPGTELKALLASFGIKASSTCQCNKMAQQMDVWGPDESLAHMEQIVDVMQKTAKARKLPFLRLIGRRLVRIACGRARKKKPPAGQ